MEKLLLVDGLNLLFQMFYGMPSRIVNANGRAIQGTLGFVGALLKIIKRQTQLTLLFCLMGNMKMKEQSFSPIIRLTA